jgi:hypothetical protein
VFALGGAHGLRFGAVSDLHVVTSLRRAQERLSTARWSSALFILDRPSMFLRRASW